MVIPWFTNLQHLGMALWQVALAPIPHQLPLIGTRQALVAQILLVLEALQKLILEMV
jgi:hypothetical protein